MDYQNACTTPGCDGDARYAAPGRGHSSDCEHPASQPGLWCAMCQFPEDTAKMKTDTACCTGCRAECVCLDRIWMPPRRRS